MRPLLVACVALLGSRTVEGAKGPHSKRSIAVAHGSEGRKKPLGGKVHGTVQVGGKGAAPGAPGASDRDLEFSFVAEGDASITLSPEARVAVTQLVGMAKENVSTAQAPEKMRHVEKPASETRGTAGKIDKSEKQKTPPAAGRVKKDSKRTDKTSTSRKHAPPETAATSIAKPPEEAIRDYEKHMTPKLEAELILLPLGDNVQEVKKEVVQIGDDAKRATALVAIGNDVKTGQPAFAHVGDLGRASSQQVVETMSGFQSADGRTEYHSKLEPVTVNKTAIPVYVSDKGESVVIVDIPQVTKGPEAIPLAKVRSTIDMVSKDEALKEVSQRLEEPPKKPTKSLEQLQSKLLDRLAAENYCTWATDAPERTRLQRSFETAIKKCTARLLKAVLKTVKSKSFVCFTPIPLFIHFFPAEELEQMTSFTDQDLSRSVIYFVENFYRSRSQAEQEASKEVIEYIRKADSYTLRDALYKVMQSAPENIAVGRDVLDWFVYYVSQKEYRFRGLVSKYLASTGRFASLDRKLVASRLGTLSWYGWTDILKKLLSDLTNKFEEDLEMVIMHETLIPKLDDVIGMDSIREYSVVESFRKQLSLVLSDPHKAIVMEYLQKAPCQEAFEHFIRHLRILPTDPKFIVLVEQLLCRLPGVAKHASGLITGRLGPLAANKLRHTVWPEDMCKDKTNLEECLAAVQKWATDKLAQEKSVKTLKPLPGQFKPSITHDPVLGECKIDDFTVGRELGEGGFGTVRLASHPKETKIALKNISAYTISRSPETVEAEEKYSNAAKSKHVVPIRCSMVGGDRSANLAMKFYQNGSLRSKISSGYKFTEEEVRRIFVQIIKGMEAIHAAGIAHWDFKPDNVLMDELGNVAISDFGLAEKLGPGQYLDGGVGTYLYRAPEVARRLNPRAYLSSDWYSVGITFYEIATGKRPFGYEDATWYSVVRFGTTAFPKTGNKEIDEVIAALTKHDQVEREAAVKNIKSLRFFKGVDWTE